MKRPGKKLISNTFFLFSDWVSLTVLSFVYWFIAGKFLLPNEYGIVSTSVNTIILLSGFSLLGLHTTVQKLIPEYLGKNQNGNVGGLIRFSIKTVLITNIVLISIIMIFSQNIASLLKTTNTVVFIMAASILLHSFAIQFGYVLHGFQRMKKVFLTNLYGTIIKVMTSWILLFLGFRYFGPIIGFSLSLFVIAMLRLHYIRSKINSGSVNQKHIMMEYALPAFIVYISMSIFAYAQYTILTILKNPEATGLFTIAMIITSPISIIPGTMTTALFPITSRLSATKDAAKRQRYLIQLVFRYALFVTIPLSMFLVIFSEKLILVFSKPQYLASAQLFPVLALAGLVYGSAMILYQNIYALGKPKTNRNIAVITTTVFLTLAILLTYLYSAFGISVAYLLSAIVIFTLSFVYIRKYIGFGFPFTSTLKIVVASSVSMGLFYLAVKLVESFIIEIAFMGVTTLVYFLILLMMKFYREEDIKILNSAANKIPFIKKPLRKLSKLLSKFV